MNKALVSGIAAVALTLVGGAGALWQTDRQIDMAIARLQQQSPSTVSLTVIEDHNRLFSRDLLLQVDLSEGDQTLSLVAENAIVKRPWATRVTHSVRLNPVTLSAIDMPALQQAVQKTLVDQPVLTGLTKVNPLGAFNSDLHTQPIDERIDVVALQVSAIQFSASGSLSGTQDIAMDWAGLTLTIDDLESLAFTVLPMTFSAQGTHLGASLFAGEQRFSGEGVSVQARSEWQSSDVRIGNYEIVSTGELADERYHGDLSVQIDRLEIADGERDISLTQLALSAGLSGIDVEHYQQLSEAVASPQFAANDLTEVKMAASALLKDGFELSIDDLSALIDGEAMRMSASVTVPENNIADLNNPFSLLGLLTRVSAHSSLRVAMALEDNAQMSDAIMMLMMSGGLIVDGSDYVMDFSFRDGQALLNGQPMQLPM